MDLHLNKKSTWVLGLELLIIISCFLPFYSAIGVSYYAAVGFSSASALQIFLSAGSLLKLILLIAFIVPIRILYFLLFKKVFDKSIFCRESVIGLLAMILYFFAIQSSSPAYNIGQGIGLWIYEIASIGVILISIRSKDNKVDD